MVVNALWVWCAMVVNGFRHSVAVGMVFNAACYSTLWVGSWVRLVACGFASCVGICACARFLRFARGFDVNGRQLAVNASQLFLGLLCSLWSSMLCGYGAQWSLMVLPQPQGAASLALG